MAEKELRKLNRKELLQMMVEFSEEAEAAKAHEKEMQKNFDIQREQLLQQMADERSELLSKFDEEKAEMRAKFNEQKEQIEQELNNDIAGMKARYEREIEELNIEHRKEFEGFKNRLEKEKAEIRAEVDDKLQKIGNAGNLAEAVLSINGVMEAAQKSAEKYLETIKKNQV